MKYRFPFLMLLFLPPAVSFGLGSRESQSTSAVVRMGTLKGPTGVGMVRLFDVHPELPRGDTFTLEALPSADAMAARLVAGDLDAAVLPVNLAAKLYTSGLPYRLAAVVGEGMVSILATDPGIHSFEDLAGHEIHVAGQGATPEYLMRTIAKKRGMDPDKDFALSFRLPYPEIAASLVAGRISVAVLPEPFATQVLLGNPQARIPFSLGALWTEATGHPNYPMSVLVFRDSLITDHPKTAFALMEAYRASIEWVLKHPGEAGALVEKYDLGLKAGVASAAIPRSAYVFVPAPQARPDVEALLSVFLALEPKSVGGRLPDASFYAEIKGR